MAPSPTEATNISKLRVFALCGAALLAFSASASGIEAAMRMVGAADTAFCYDDARRLTSMTDATGAATMSSRITAARNRTTRLVDFAASSECDES